MIFLYLFLFSYASIFLSSLATGEYEVSYAGTDIDEIRERALLFYDVAHYNTKGVVFPDLRFKCSGSITSVWFIARISSEDVRFSASDGRVIYPTFQLWTRGNISTGRGLSSYQGAVKDSRSPPLSRNGLHVHVNGSDMALYEYRLEDPMPFEAGYILGIWLRHSLLQINYLKGGGVRNFLLTNRRLTYFPSSDWEPLLALEVSDESCLDSFLNVETLKQYMEISYSYDYSYEEDDYSNEDETPQDDDYYDDTSQYNDTMDIPPSNQLSYVFPYLQFTENGLLEKWLFAAKLVPPLSNPISIEFQVWRREDTRHVSITTTNVTSPARTGYINVYEQIVHPPLPVVAGDYIGVAVQSLSHLRPQWVPSSGELYQRIPQGTQGAVFTFFDRAIPLFAAQIRVTGQPIQTSSVSPTVTSSEPLMMTSALPSLPLSTATVVSSQSEVPEAEVTTTIPPTQHTRPPTLSGSTTASTAPTPASSPMLTASPVLNPSPSISNEAPPNLSDPSNSSTAIAVTVVVSVIVLLITAAIGVVVFILCMRRKTNRKEQTGGSVSKQQQTRSSFFDNPVYQHVQRRVSHKESNGYSSIVDPIYLEVPAGQVGTGRGLDAVCGDGDSGYAEPGRIVVTPSHSATPTPVPSSPLHILPSPSPHPTTHTYQTLEQPQDYIEPQPRSRASGDRDMTTPDASNLDIHRKIHRKTIDHEYHELDPNTGGYHRLFTKGIYVPTQEERRQSTGSDSSNYATIGERLYATLAETNQQNALSFFEECDVYWKPASTSAGLYSQLAQKKYREILHSQIKVQHSLGSGHFGVVNKGEWQSVKGPVEVAVKTLKRGSSEEDTVRFLQEAAIMGQFRHPNIVQLHGVVTLAEHTMIILEYLSQGDLGTVLLNRRPMPGSAVSQDTPTLLMDFCRDVASGMEYLQRKAFVHRDLAARNILVSKQNSCKIGDFGMSRNLLDENYYVSKGGLIPLKWTAPEALHYRKYSTASDVWSYGVVMYEIWSLGHKPFEGYTNPEVQKMLDRGERLAPPPGCPRGVYSLMVQCWHPDHASRPTFLHLLKTLNSSRSQLLSWSHEDTWGMAESIVLGASLRAGRKLYTDLQNAYITVDQ